MSSRARKHRQRAIGAAVVVSAALIPSLGAPGAALGAPQTAAPDAGSPAGTEYALPFDAGRGAGGGGSHHNGGSPSAFGGGGGSAGGGGGGTGGTGTTGNASPLFGAGILPV